MWFVFALLSAIFISIRKVGEKQLSHKLHHFTFGWALQLFSLPIIFLALLLGGELLNPLTLGPKFWIPTILLLLTFYPLSTFLQVHSLRHGELSKILPLQSFGPVFALLLGWILLGQAPSAVAAGGIAVVVLGVYVLNLKGRYLHNPFGIFKNDKASVYTLINLVLIAFAGVLNAIAIQASEPIYYSFVSTLLAVPILYASARIMKIKEAAMVREHAMPLAIAGGLFGASFVTHMMALSVGPLAYVTSVRGSSVLMGTLLGFMYLKEPVTKPKIAALILITIGSVVIGLS